jgi:hypothetical protein
MTAENDTPAVAVDLADILLAARSSCPVLITALPQDALRIARAIVAERGCADRLMVGESALAGSPTEQALLLGRMDDRPGTSPRLFASTSVSLFDLVQQGMFDARLFYRLNVVHVVARGPEGPPLRPLFL